MTEIIGRKSNKQQTRMTNAAQITHIHITYALYIYLFTQISVGTKQENK